MSTGDTTPTYFELWLRVWHPVDTFIEKHQTSLFIFDVFIKFLLHTLIIGNVVEFDTSIKYSSDIPKWVSNEEDVSAFVRLLYATINLGCTSLAHIVFHILLSLYHKYSSAHLKRLKYKSIHLHTKIKTLFVLIYLFLICLIVYSIYVSAYLLHPLGGDIDNLDCLQLEEGEECTISPRSIGPSDSYSLWVLYRYMQFTFSSVHIWILYLRMVLSPEYFPPSITLICIFISTFWNAGLGPGNEKMNFNSLSTTCGVTVYVFSQYYSIKFFIRIAQKLKRMKNRKKATYINFSTEKLLSRFIFVQDADSASAQDSIDEQALQKSGLELCMNLPTSRGQYDLGDMSMGKGEIHGNWEATAGNKEDSDELAISDIITLLFSVIATVEVSTLMIRVIISIHESENVLTSLPTHYEESAFTYMLMTSIVLALFIAVTTLFMSLLLYAYTNTAIKFHDEARVRSSVMKEILPTAVLEKLMAAPAGGKGGHGTETGSVNSGSYINAEADAMIVSFDDIDSVDDFSSSSFGQVVDFAQPTFKGSKIMYRIQGNAPASNEIDGLLKSIAPSGAPTTQKTGTDALAASLAPGRSGSSSINLGGNSPYSAVSRPQANEAKVSLPFWVFLKVNDVYGCRSSMIPLIVRRKWFAYCKFLRKHTNAVFLLPCFVQLLIGSALVIVMGSDETECDLYTKLQSFGIGISILMTSSAVAMMLSGGAIIYAFMIQDTWKSVKTKKLLQSLASAQLVHYPLVIIICISVVHNFNNGQSSEAIFANLLSPAVSYCLILFIFSMHKLCPFVFTIGKCSLGVLGLTMTILLQQIFSIYSKDVESADGIIIVRFFLRICSAILGCIAFSMLLEFIIIFLVKLIRSFGCYSTDGGDNCVDDGNDNAAIFDDHSETDDSDDEYGCVADCDIGDGDEDDSVEDEEVSGSRSEERRAPRWISKQHKLRALFLNKNLNHKDFMGGMLILGVCFMIYIIAEMHIPTIGGRSSVSHTCDVVPANRFKVVIAVCIFTSLQQNLISVIIQHVATRYEMQLVRMHTQMEFRTKLIKALLSPQVAEDVLANRTSLASLRSAATITRATGYSE